MKRFSLFAVAFVLCVFLIPVAGNAIPTEGCWCPGGSGTTQWQTTWGAAPAYSCSDLANLAHSYPWQYANSQCARGVCSLTFANEACVDAGCSTQHYDLVFTYKCYLCID